MFYNYYFSESYKNKFEFVQGPFFLCIPIIQTNFIVRFVKIKF